MLEKLSFLVDLILIPILVSFKKPNLSKLIFNKPSLSGTQLSAKQAEKVVTGSLECVN